MHIVSLEANNVKRLKAVSIHPDGNMVVVGGNNGQGKSSVLDSILYAIGGASTHCPQPVRNGEAKAKVVCALDNGLTITRTFTAAGGTSLVVTNGDGAKYPSPQSILDAMVGKLSFDPLEFSRMNSRDQLTTLKSLVGLDFSALDAQRKAAFENRTLVNRELKSALAVAESLPHYDDAPKEEQSVADLMDELKRRQSVNSTCDQNERELRDVEARIAKGTDYISTLEAQLAEITQKIAAAKSTISDLHKDADKCREAASGLVREDEQEIVGKMGDLQNLNAKHAANAKHAEAAKKVSELQADAETLTAEIEGIDKEKSALIKSANFPIAGMGFDENGVLLNGLPFSQASDAEKIRASVAMGLAMNPKLKVVLIRDGSLLDEASLALAAQMAAEHDAQVWIERVGKGNECSVIIEDGQVQPS